jgi:hypothetical protein
VVITAASLGVAITVIMATLEQVQITPILLVRAAQAGQGAARSVMVRGPRRVARKWQVVQAAAAAIPADSAAVVQTQVDHRVVGVQAVLAVVHSAMVRVAHLVALKLRADLAVAVAIPEGSLEAVQTQADHRQEGVLVVQVVARSAMVPVRLPEEHK